MGKLYKDMTLEEKERHYQVTENYRKKNPEPYREAAKRYYYKNLEASKARHKAWREDNREYVKDQQRERKRSRKLWAIEYLGGECKECHSTFHPAIYEFHHRDPETKDRDPSKMLQLSLIRLTAELDKCDLLCANCHRLIHHKDNYS